MTFQGGLGFVWAKIWNAPAPSICYWPIPYIHFIHHYFFTLRGSQTFSGQGQPFSAKIMGLEILRGWKVKSSNPHSELMMNPYISTSGICFFYRKTVYFDPHIAAIFICFVKTKWEDTPQRTYIGSVMMGVVLNFPRFLEHVKQVWDKFSCSIV